LILRSFVLEPKEVLFLLFFQGLGSLLQILDEDGWSEISLLLLLIFFPNLKDSWLLVLISFCACIKNLSLRFFRILLDIVIGLFVLLSPLTRFIGFIVFTEPFLLVLIASLILRVSLLVVNSFLAMVSVVFSRVALFSLLKVLQVVVLSPLSLVVVMRSVPSAFHIVIAVPISSSVLHSLVAVHVVARVLVVVVATVVVVLILVIRRTLSVITISSR
jgi:hypothetical protein